MKVAAIELVHLQVPLVEPFNTVHSSRAERALFLVRLTSTDGVVGWGENVAEATVGYSRECLATSLDATRNELSPLVFAADSVGVGGVGELFSNIDGFQFAKAAFEQAVLDIELKQLGISAAQWLGATSDFVRPGVVVGLQKDMSATLALVDQYLEEGYRRIKFKIGPGNDVALARAVRAHVGDTIQLQVDANGTYSRDSCAVLRELDEFGLLMIEQPLPADDLEGSANLAQLIATPICLDEGILSLSNAQRAVESGAGRIINIKPGRVGGIVVAKQIHDYCLNNNIGAWVGGMLESGVGRGLNIALGALPGFNFPGDLSASGRYYNPDLTEPFELENGQIRVPTQVGASREPLFEMLQMYNAKWETLTA